MAGKLSAAEIYRQINGGPGPEALSVAQQSAAELKVRLQDRRDQVADLGLEVQEGWKGEAGSAAANAAAPLADASQQDSARVGVADNAVANQIESFRRAQNSVVPVSDKPPEMTATGLFDSMSIGDMGRYAAEVGQWQAESEANVQAFTAYHQASTSNGQTMPSAFAPLTDAGAPISMADGSGGAKDAGGPGGSKVTPPPVVGGSVGASGGRPGVESGGGGGYRPPPGPEGTGGTGDRSGSTPGPQRVPAAQYTGPGTDSTTTSSWNPSSTSETTPRQGGQQFGPGGRPFGGTSTGTGPGGGGSGFGPIGTGSGGGSGFGPGTGGHRGGGGVGSGPGGAGRTGGGPGAGRFSGALPGEGGAARGGTGVPGSTGTTGRAGAAGMPMGAGAGRGQGGEDKERQRPDYLKDPDPDDTFGGFDGKTTPPVIGETRKDHN
ncbi:PPE domain-containing protein [Amycolatopsis cihanbeyliensis]|uniref:PPE family protein n=1 Tax=Amycolatopsis cihanbeyliensis TaxID=1128664 RepID=A0A542DJP2_AMYCI|nr:PPE domain-containing protein [Amycolatopsis cihanbeyliensis]TQJ03296.1 PPE family protein [Amycolatopsis cihanbeyliensis]